MYSTDEDLTGPATEREVVAFYYGLIAVAGAMAGLAAWKAGELVCAAVRWVLGLGE